MKTSRPHSQSRRNVRRSGFTLLEVLLVLAILGVIAAMVIPNLLGRQQEAYIKATKTSIAGLESAVKLYASENDGTFPDSLEKMFNPGADPVTGKQLPAYLEKEPKDAWKKPLQYQYANDGSLSKPKIWSFGPDGQDGTADDVTNWSQN